MYEVVGNMSAFRSGEYPIDSFIMVFELALCSAGSFMSRIMIGLGLSR